MGLTLEKSGQTYPIEGCEAGDGEVWLEDLPEPSRSGLRNGGIWRLKVAGGDLAGFGSRYRLSIIEFYLSLFSSS